MAMHTPYLHYDPPLTDSLRPEMMKMTITQLYCTGLLQVTSVQFAFRGSLILYYRMEWGARVCVRVRSEGEGEKMGGVDHLS